MKICRFNEDRLGVALGDEIADVSAALAAMPALRWPLPAGDPLIRCWPDIAARVADLLPTAPRVRRDAVALHAPITSPTKIIGIARNRRNLATESIDIGPTAGGQRQDGDPIQMFIKAPSAIAGPADGVRLRFAERRNDPEAELTVIIGKAGTQIAEVDAFKHIFGYCIGLDMTLRGKESPSSRKSIDTYAVLGPWIVTADELSDPDHLDMRFEVNGALVQSANTRDLAFGIAEIVAHASRFYTLHPGDAIMVGTPVGFEAVRPGDRMVAHFQGIGDLVVAVSGYD